MEDLSKRSIIDMARGAIKERVDYEMTRVVENILDPNTSATAATLRTQLMFPAGMRKSRSALKRPRLRCVPASRRPQTRSMR